MSPFFYFLLQARMSQSYNSLWRSAGRDGWADTIVTVPSIERPRPARSIAASTNESCAPGCAAARCPASARWEVTLMAGRQSLSLSLVLFVLVAVGVAQAGQSPLPLAAVHEVLRFLPLTRAAGARPVQAVWPIERVSVASDGSEGDGAEMVPSVSADGRYVVFQSTSTNLAPIGYFGINVFIRDRQAGTTELLCVSSTGAPASARSFALRFALSADGRYAIFGSWANNLVPGDTNNCADIFFRDLQTGQTERVSVGCNGVEANGNCVDAAISADGRFVAFESAASNLVPNDNNSQADIFVRDRATGTTERVSVASSGAEANFSSGSPCISPDGRYVAFVSAASNLVAGDTNGTSDVFVHDRVSGTTTRVSVTSAGQQLNGTAREPSITWNGHLVAFTGAGVSNLPPYDIYNSHVYVHDCVSGDTRLVDVKDGGEASNGPSYLPVISADGRYVVFQSLGTNLVADHNGCVDVFVRNRATGQTRRVSLGRDGAEANGGSVEPSISGDGRCVAFISSATNLVPDDTNFVQDAFAVDPVPLYTPPEQGDFDGDGDVTVDDLPAFMEAWRQGVSGHGGAWNPLADMNGDGRLGYEDVIAFLEAMLGSGS